MRAYMFLGNLKIILMAMLLTGTITPNPTHVIFSGKSLDEITQMLSLNQVRTLQMK